METFHLFIYFTVLFSFTVLLEYTSAVDSLYRNQEVIYPQTLKSANGFFEFGFFSPGNSTDYYVGIWFAGITNQKAVWVSNRKYPTKGDSAILSIKDDGNIEVSDGPMSYRVTNNSGGSNSTYARLLDSGNLILRDQSQQILEILWQSFDYPTDTLLPGMKIGYDKFSGYSWSLVSWKSAQDPAPGNFTLTIDQLAKSLVIKQGDETYWQDEPSKWNLTLDVGNLTLVYDYLAWSPVQLDESGLLKLLLRSPNSSKFITSKSSKCNELYPCGAFNICNESAYTPCDCLQGFKPLKPGQPSLNGCIRKKSLQCNSSTTSTDGFLRIENVTLPSTQIHMTGNSSVTCEAACLINCSCIAYASDQENCLFFWDRNLFELKQPVDNYNTIDVHVRLAVSEFKETRQNETLNDPGDTTNSGRTMKILIATVITTGLTMLILSLIIYYTRRNQARKGENLLLFDFNTRLKTDDKKLTKEDRPGKRWKKEVKLPFFSFASVAAATENFSSANKLGEGGFGPVYKGKLQQGGEIAVKRLSRTSGQGREELENEALLIAKLQHKNLARLLGCCIERNEKILIYEFMPNKSLDFFLFDADPAKRRRLDWGIRARIIDGIAQGLLYLHQYSRLRIIHRDLKASNILLDEEMNPKISDFGMARICGGNESQANTNRIVGTYGYMSPEYALEGLFSVKSDVFSFGVLMLEIVSGKKNTGFYQTDSLNLLGYAWDLWTIERIMDLMDPALQTDSATSIQLLPRYVHIALVCVQESAEDRPTMSDVVSMLNNETAALPSPKQPAFSNVRSIMNAKSGMQKQDIHSHNSLSVTILEAR